MNKGTWALADALYWFFYIPMTAIIVISLVIIPTNVMKATIQPVELDASIMEERLSNKLTEYSPITGTNINKVGDVNAANLILSQKRHAYKVAVDNLPPVFGNPDFYDEAIPLTPVKHKRFTSATEMKKKEKTSKVIIDQVYTEKYG